METKKVRKLTLTKETVRNLDDRQMERVVGGVTMTPACLTEATGPCSFCTRACSVCCL